jgi:hypothetical protein
MSKRVAVFLCVIALAGLAGGCSKCGPWWNDGTQSCRADPPVR